jgi:transposase
MRGRCAAMPTREVIEPILRPKRPSDGRGRPWQDTRAVLNGILWVLGTGASGASCPINIRRTRLAIAASSSGVREGKLEDILRILAEELPARGKSQLEEYL